MIYKRGRFYSVKFKHHGKLVRKSTRAVDVRTARILERAIRNQFALGDHGVIQCEQWTLKDFLQKKFLPFYANAKFSTRKYYERGIIMILNAGLGEERLNQVTTFTAAEIESTFSALSPSTINCPLRTLRRALKLAEEWRLLTHAPKIRLSQGEHVRERVLTEKEIGLYLPWCRQPWRDVATIMLETGMRPGEVFALRTEDFQLREGTFMIRAGKSRASRRYLIITPAIENILLRRGDKPGFLFPANTPEGHINRNNIKPQHAAALIKANIPPFPPYILRHTALTHIALRTDPFTLAKIAGHSNVTMISRYVHPELQSIREAFGGGIGTGHMTDEQPS
jgi:integrase